MTKKDSITNKTYLDYELLQDESKVQQMEFSILDGNNFYRVSKDSVKLENTRSFLGVHVPTDTPVRITPISQNKATIRENQSQIRWYKKFIWNVMPQEQYEWPVDLVEYGEGLHCTLAYVFPLKAYPQFVSVKELLYQDKTSKRLDWRNEEIRDLSRNFLKCFSVLHQNGFYYNDFDMNRIFYEPKSRQIFLRHNTNLRAWKKEHGSSLSVNNMIKSFQNSIENNNDMVNVEELAIEFLPPYVGKEKYYMGNLDEYSICSILFRLMIGRMPYEGKGLSSFGDIFDPIRDVDSASHQYYFEHYHKYPIFIFDLEDDSNSLGPMSENDLPRERWNALPEKIKEMFRASLGNMQEERRNKLVLYSPDTWLEELNRWCW